MADVNVTVASLTTVPVAVDTTLTHSGQAADAKAVGDALALKASKAEANVKVNNQVKDVDGEIDLYASNIPMEESGTDTVASKIEAIEGSVETIEDDIDTIEENIDTIESDLASFKAGPVINGHTTLNAPASSDITLNLPSGSGTLATLSDLPAFEIRRTSVSVPSLASGATVQPTVTVGFSKPVKNIVVLGVTSGISAAVPTQADPTIAEDDMSVSFKFTARNFTSSDRTSSFNLYVSYFVQY